MAAVERPPGGPGEPACVQAFRVAKTSPTGVERIVEYVAFMDLGRTLTGDPPASIEPPLLSQLFSGMRLSVPDAREQLVAGLSIFRTMVDRELDPVGPLPELPEWKPWLARRSAERQAAANAAASAKHFDTREGRRVPYVETNHVGAVEALYKMGCEVVIAHSPAFGDPRLPKVHDRRERPPSRPVAPDTGGPRTGMGWARTRHDHWLTSGGRLPTPTRDRKADRA